MKTTDRILCIALIPIVVGGIIFYTLILDAITLCWRFQQWIHYHCINK